MLSLEVAQKLRDAGLVWNPQMGDFFAYMDGERVENKRWVNTYVISGYHNSAEHIGGKKFFFNEHLCTRGNGCIMDEIACSCMNQKGIVPYPDIDKFSVSAWEKQLWIPRLDQLLAEIDRQGYVFFFGPGAWDNEKVHGYYCEVIRKDADISEESPEWDEFRKSELDNTIASALLWILERGKE